MVIYEKKFFFPDILIIRDPFEEEELPGIRCNTTNTQMMLFNQRPPQYINTGNPLDSGGQLELPRSECS